MEKAKENEVRLSERTGKVFHAYRAAGQRIGRIRRFDILSGEISISVPRRFLPPRRPCEVRVTLRSNEDASTTVKMTPAFMQTTLPPAVTEILNRFAREELSSD